MTKLDLFLCKNKGQNCLLRCNLKKSQKDLLTKFGQYAAIDKNWIICIVIHMLYTYYDASVDIAQLLIYLYLYISVVFTHVSIVIILHNAPLYST